MITIFLPDCNTISQEIYDNTIASLEFTSLSCTCNHSGCLTKHAYYTRRIKTTDGILGLTVCRVKCSICNRTHAILLSSIIPYSQLSLQDQASVISNADRKSELKCLMTSCPDIYEGTVSYILRQYRLFWEQRLLSEGIPLLPAGGLIKQCFRSFSRQFMQIKSTPNILFFKPT